MNTLKILLLCLVAFCATASAHKVTDIQVTHKGRNLTEAKNEAISMGLRKAIIEFLNTKTSVEQAHFTPKLPHSLDKFMLSFQIRDENYKDQIFRAKIDYELNGPLLDDLASQVMRDEIISNPYQQIHQKVLKFKFKNYRDFVDFHKGLGFAVGNHMEIKNFRSDVEDGNLITTATFLCKVPNPIDFEAFVGNWQRISRDWELSLENFHINQ